MIRQGKRKVKSWFIQTWNGRMSKSFCNAWINEGASKMSQAAQREKSENAGMSGRQEGEMFYDFVANSLSTGQSSTAFYPAEALCISTQENLLHHSQPFTLCRVVKQLLNNQRAPLTRTCYAHCSPLQLLPVGQMILGVQAVERLEMIWLKFLAQCVVDNNSILTCSDISLFLTSSPTLYTIWLV